MTTEDLHISRCCDCPFFESESGPACGEAGCYLNDDIDPEDLDHSSPPKSCALRRVNYRVIYRVSLPDEIEPTFEEALFEKFGREAFLSNMKDFLSRHPECLADALAIVNDGIRRRIEGDAKAAGDD